MFLMGGQGGVRFRASASSGTLDALHVLGSLLADSNDVIVTPRGVNTEGVANFQFYTGGGLAYLDKLLGTDADGGVWHPGIVRLPFERFPCCDPTRLYQPGDPRIPFCIPDTSQFPDWPASTTVVEGSVVKFGGTRYSANQRYWRADMGYFWNPDGYIVGERVSGLPQGTTHVYECTVAATPSAHDPAPWDMGPTGTSGTPQVDGLGNTWVYVGEWGDTGSSEPFAGPTVSDYYGTWYPDDFVMWSVVGPDLTPEEAEEAWTTFVTTVLDPMVQRCVDNGLYVIICDFDFGPMELPLRYARALEFWGRVSQSQWANHPNVFFNLYNESTDVGGFNGWTWTNNKPYIQAVVDLIRSNGAQNVILCTTPAFCAFTYMATADPLDDDNTLYDNHSYSDYFVGTGNDTNLSIALATDEPVFCGEFGSNHEDDVSITDAFLNDIMGRIETSRGSPHSAAGWAAWAFTDDWNPHFFEDSLLTDPSYYGTSIRNLFDEFA